MIVRKEIVKAADEKFITPEIEANIKGLLDRVNPIRLIWGKPMVVSSGFRNPERNAAVGGRTKSQHMLGKALDIRDPDGTLARWLLDNIFLLEEYGLWLEDPRYTKGWVHLDTRPRKNRVFIP